MFYEKDLREIQSMNNPPEAVKRTLCATLRLLGHSKAEAQNWGKVKIVIGKKGNDSLVKRCQNFNKDSITPDVAAEVQESLRDLDVDRMRNVNKSVGNVFVWTKSMADQVEPGSATAATKTA